MIRVPPLTFTGVEKPQAVAAFTVKVSAVIRR
jgi:hypothetical protein